MFLQAIVPLHLLCSVKLIPLPRKEKYLSLYLPPLWKLWDKNNFKETDIREIVLVRIYVYGQLTQEMGIQDFILISRVVFYLSIMI